MKQAQWKLIVLTLIVASLALTGCSYERKTPSQTQSTAQAGSAGVPTAALIAATTTPALAVPTKQPTTLAIQATATPAVSAPAGSSSTTSAPATTEVPASTGSTAAPITSAPVAPQMGVPPSQEQIHVVQPGQNLFRIALQYGYDVETVARYNGIHNPEMIYVGQEIRIPAGGTVVTPPNYGYEAPSSGFSGNVYIVDPGDTLLSIAARYGVSVEALCSANHLTNADTIYVGQRLNIP